MNRTFHFLGIQFFISMGDSYLWLYKLAKAYVEENFL